MAEQHRGSPAGQAHPAWAQTTRGDKINGTAIRAGGGGEGDAARIAVRSVRRRREYFSRPKSVLTELHKQSTCQNSRHVIAAGCTAVACATMQLWNGGLQVRCGTPRRRPEIGTSGRSVAEGRTAARDTGPLADLPEIIARGPKPKTTQASGLSGRADSNCRPHGPEPCALPNCATPRSQTNGGGGWPPRHFLSSPERFLGLRAAP
jgi:hypothetical protein